MIDLSSLHENRSKKGTTMNPTNKPYKAIYAFVLAFATALYATIQGRTDLEEMKVIDWVIVVLGALVTAGGVYAIDNRAGSPQA